MSQSFTGLGGGVVLAVVLAYLLIVVNFQSWLDPFIIISALPGALAGITWALPLTHTTLNVPSLTGHYVRGRGYRQQYSDGFLRPRTNERRDAGAGGRRSAEAANASYQAAGADLENVNSYWPRRPRPTSFTLGEVDAENRILDDTVASLEKAAALVQNRHDGGIASGLDVAQEQALLEATCTQATWSGNCAPLTSTRWRVVRRAAPDFRVAAGTPRNIFRRSLPGCHPRCWNGARTWRGKSA